jgi:hypothetical protein
MLRSLPISADAETSSYICLSIMPTASRESPHQFFPSKKPGPRLDALKKLKFFHSLYHINL